MKMKTFALIAATFGSFLIIAQAGVPTQSPLPEGCTVPCIDAVFVLDVSMSIETEQNFQLMKKFITDTFSSVNISADCSRGALIVFARNAEIIFNLKEYTDEASLRNAIDQITLSQLELRAKKYRTGTNTPAALELMLTAAKNGSLGLSNDRIRIAVVITDGRPHLKHEDKNQEEANQKTKMAGEKLRGANIYKQIYAIGIQGNKSKHKLRKEILDYFADPPRLTFLLYDFNRELFSQLRINITREFCEPCFLTQCPNGSRCITCNDSGTAYCEKSCDYENGGCNEGRRCVEVVVPTCNPDQCCSRVDITCPEANCTTMGQVYSQNAKDCVPTCANPNPACSEKTREGCHCPDGTVLDEIQNKCVPLSKCRCPPSCSHDYCNSTIVKNSKRPVPCMRGSPTSNETECMDPCKLTYCNACYYSNCNHTLSRISECDDCCEDRLCLACVREWAVCVEEIDEMHNECKGDCETEENFKCYNYFGCI